MDDHTVVYSVADSGESYGSVDEEEISDGQNNCNVSSGNVSSGNNRSEHSHNSQSFCDPMLPHSSYCQQPQESVSSASKQRAQTSQRLSEGLLL